MAHDEPDTTPVTFRSHSGSDDAPASDGTEASDAAGVNLGTPLGQLAVGAVLVLLLGGWLLYRLGGWLLVLIALGGLIALAVLVVATPFIWRALRNRRSGGRSGRSWQASSARRSPAVAARVPRGGAKSGRSGLRSALASLRPGRRSRKSAAGGRAAGEKHKPSVARRAGRSLAGAARRLVGLSGRSNHGSSGGNGQARRRGPVRRAAAAIGRGARATGRGVGSLLRPAGRAARRAGAALGGGLRRAGSWANTASGGRLGRAWARLRSASWPRALLARLARWDRRLTGGLAAALWSRWRRRKGDAAEHAEEAPGQDDQDTVELPTISQNTNQSTSSAAMAATTQGVAMSDFALVSHATELPTIAAGYESDHMMDVRGHMQMLRELPLAAGTAVRIWTERLAADYPLNQDAAEALQRVYDAFGAAVEACDEAVVVFEGSHAADIERQLQPRTNEQKWNAGQR